MRQRQAVVSVGSVICFEPERDSDRGLTGVCSVNVKLGDAGSISCCRIPVRGLDAGWVSARIPEATESGRTRPERRSELQPE